MSVLKPQNLVQAAEADLKRRQRNMSGETFGGVLFERYAFHRDHVRRAKNIKQLLLLALMDPPLKVFEYPEQEWPVVRIATMKKETRLIYSDGALLVRAIRSLHHA